MIKRTLPAVFGLLLWLAASSSVDAQIAFGRKPSIQAGTVFSGWELSGDEGTTKLSQVWFHLSSYVPLKDNFEAKINLFSLKNSLDDEVGKVDLTGLGDSRITLSHSFSDDRILVSLGLNVPTGKRELDPITERRIIRALSESALDFPTRRYGEGLGLTALVGGVRHLGKVNLGGSISFEYRGKYKPYMDTYEYDPGDVLKGSVVIERKSNLIRWSLRSAYGLHSDDKSNSVKIFRQSPTLELRLHNGITTGKVRLTTTLGYLSRGDSKRYSGDDGDLAVKLYGNEIHASTRILYKLSSQLRVGPTAVLKLISSNKGLGTEKIGDSRTLKLGIAARSKFSRNHSANLELRYLTGEADDGKLDLSGIQIILNYSLVL